MVRLDRVTKRFGNTLALDALSLEAGSGRTTVLIGPSGCGKSTALRLIVGLIEPDEGQVLVEDDPVETSRLAALRRRIGYVIQEGGLFPHLTARANVTLMARQEGWDQERIDERLRHLLTLTGLEDALLESYPAELSGGQRQRVGLMRALMLDPDHLLLDEPLGALDPLIRADLQEDLRDIFRRLRKTVVLVTHDMHEAAYFGDQIALMKSGHLVQKGGIEDLLHRPEDPFVERFIRAQRSELEL